MPDRNLIKILRTTSDDPNFRALVKFLDQDLARRDGKDHAFFAQYNNLDTIRHAVVAYDNELPVGCGAIKEYDKYTMEVKRMYTLPESRGKGIASLILSELEEWATELSYSRCILETGIRQPEAIRLYKKNSYQLIPNYGQYKEVASSRCFEKHLGL